MGKGYSLFCKAFGSDENEFMKLLYMPEAMIIYRFYFEGTGLTDEWRNSFKGLTDAQLATAKPIIKSNDLIRKTKWGNYIIFPLNRMIRQGQVSMELTFIQKLSWKNFLIYLAGNLFEFVSKSSKYYIRW